MNAEIAKSISEMVFKYNNLPEKPNYQTIMQHPYIYMGTFNRESCFDLTACCGLRKMSFFCYEIKHLCVDKELRNKGMGKWMLYCACEYVKSQGVPLAFMTVMQENKKMINLSQSCGFINFTNFKNANTKHNIVAFVKKID